MRTISVNYGCECNEDCGLEFSKDEYYDEAITNAEKRLKSSYNFSILHPDCPNLMKYHVLLLGEEAVVVANRVLVD